MYKIFDLHNDYFLKIDNEKRKHKYIDKTNLGAKNIISAIWTSELNEQAAMSKIESARNFVNSCGSLFLGVEDLHFLSKSNLQKFLSFRPIYAGLTWNTSNCLAGGAHESGRITVFGKSVVKQLEENHINVDTAHLNEESFMDIAKITNQPLLCSHTAFYGVQQNRRNLKDYQLKMIKDSGGLVGLCLVSEFLSGKPRCSVADIVAHIDYYACKFGIENLAIGTDFYGTKHLPKSVTNYENLSEKLSDALTKLGYTEKAINKIFYENATHFFHN